MMRHHAPSVPSYDLPFGNPFDKCVLMNNSRRYKSESKPENECIKEKNCPIFQKGDIADLLIKRLSNVDECRPSI